MSRRLLNLPRGEDGGRAESTQLTPRTRSPLQPRLSAGAFLLPPLPLNPVVHGYVRPEGGSEEPINKLLEKTAVPMVSNTPTTTIVIQNATTFILSFSTVALGTVERIWKAVNEKLTAYSLRTVSKMLCCMASPRGFEPLYSP